MRPFEFDLILPCGSHDLGTGSRYSLRGVKLNRWNDFVLHNDLWLTKLRSVVRKCTHLSLEFNRIDQDDWVWLKQGGSVWLLVHVICIGIQVLATGD